MPSYKFLSLFLLTFTALCLISCRTSTKSNPALLNLELLRGDLILCSGTQFGEVRFAQSCSDSLQEEFDLAISLLHSFEYAEAEKAFVKIIDEDPNCAMAYWGVAMSLYHTLWAPPGEKDLKKGSQILAIAATVPKTGREQEYLDAIEAYYHNWESVDVNTRALNMTNKMGEIYQTHPDDIEAAILYALALNSTADPTDKNYTQQRKAGAILESLYPTHPNHPGIAHYIIHNYDNPVLAEKALPTARRYALIAPASAHAQHMPSHIFTRLGLWDESISSNLQSTSSAVCYAENAGFEGHWDEELHGMDYLVYAYLQKGDNQKAKEQLAYLRTIKQVFPVNFKDAYAIAAIPARMALENKDWTSASALELPPVIIPWKDFPWQNAILHFTRALGAAHLGIVPKAAQEIEVLQQLHQALLDQQNAYEANQVAIQIKAATAWLNYANGNSTEALSLMQEAADMEDATEKHPVTPCEVLPARELLGDLLLAMDDAAGALKAYETDLRDHPNRFNALYGAAIASVQLGNEEKAMEYFNALLALTHGVGSDRPELTQAKVYVRNI